MSKAPASGHGYMTMTQFLDRQISIAQSRGKTQKQIALDCGYETPNIISMFKRGDSKVPLDKVTALADSIGADPARLFKLALAQYMGKDDMKMINRIFGTICTANEVQILETIREVTKGEDPVMTKEIERKLKAAFS